MHIVSTNGIGHTSPWSSVLCSGGYSRDGEEILPADVTALLTPMPGSDNGLIDIVSANDSELTVPDTGNDSATEAERPDISEGVMETVAPYLNRVDDRVTPVNWYDASVNQFDRIDAGGSVLLNDQVDQLVAAMAAYDVPAGVGNVIPQDVVDSLQPVLTENWHAML